jgi:clan AA aspartic protease (TIGR02281 family)
MFTVRWPLFARLEAVLLFPVALAQASEIATVRSFVDGGLLPTLAPLHTRLNISYSVLDRISVGLVIIVPYVIALPIADRILTVRKGYAILSFLAIAVWVAAATQLSGYLAAILPDSMLGDGAWLTFQQRTVLEVAILAFLTHAWGLWIGLRDDGELAMRLIAAHEESVYARNRTDQPGHAQDVYYRQTARFRGWQPERQLEGLGSGPRENPAAKFLSLLTWAGVIAGMGFAWHNWNDIAASRAPTPTPEVQAGAAAPRNAASVAPGTPPVMPLNPLVPAPVNARAILSPVLPAVQRPTDLSASAQAAGISIGPNEAIAERGGDGGFAFDAIVNGAHMRMLFDTGATVVALRAEDAIRLGIPVNKLNYSAKVKTANGVAEVAPVMIDSITIGNITQRAVQGFVAKQGMLQTNLLGQSFMTRLAGYNVEKNLLWLKGR